MAREILLELSLKIPLQAESWNISPSKRRAATCWEWSSSRARLEKLLYIHSLHFTAPKPRAGTVVGQDRTVSELGIFHVISDGF